MFEILNDKKNFYYPWEGTKAKNEALAFCETRHGKGTYFGLDDHKDSPTESKQN